MGQGSKLVLINATKYDWQRGHNYTYQMDGWDFNKPELKLIKSNSITGQIYIEFCEALGKTISDDLGEVIYKLVGTNYSFKIEVRPYRIHVLYDNFSNLGTRNDSNPVHIEWNHDGCMQFIIAGQEGVFISTDNVGGSTAFWMTDHFPLLRDKKLIDICIPGSHDSGMSSSHDGTAFGTVNNTKTQTRDILGQLNCGIRYFDIRPIIGSGQFYTGHYSDIGHSLGWQGARGQSIQSIVDQINNYTYNNKEVIILALSHAYQTDQKYREFTQGEWEQLFQLLKKINHLFVTSKDSVNLATDFTINDFLGQGNSAVIIVLDYSDELKPPHLGDYKHKGFYMQSEFKVNGGYSHTKDLNTMINDQKTRLKQARPTPNNNYYSVSWTLTQDNWEAAGFGDSVLALASQANTNLFQLLSEVNKNCYPNVILEDGINPDLIAIVLAINLNYIK